MGAGEKYVEVSSQALAEKLKISSKTVSRNIKRLDEDGYVKRELTPSGQRLHITSEGMDALRADFIDYKKIFHTQETIQIQGHIVSGFGEGMYYISIPGYQDQFKERLGFYPYPGTLNIKVDKKYLPNRKRLRETDFVHIDGFCDGERTYGSANCYFAHICDAPCAIIVPERTHYSEDLLEVIAPGRLRDTLKLYDGKKVTLCVGNKNPFKQ